MEKPLTHEEFIKQFPKAMEALCNRTAAVMPIEKVPIVYGVNEVFAPSRVQYFDKTISRELYWRLDK